MAGGQERILRRRIRSVQSTKKITRAMELIAASRIVKAQARGPRGAALLRQDHRGRPGPRRGRRGHRAARCSHLAPRSTASRTSSSPPTAASVAPTTRRSCARPRDRCASRPNSGVATRCSWSGARPRATSGTATTGSRRAFTGFSDNPTYEHARAIAAAVEPPFLAGEIDMVELVYTRFVSAGVPGGRAASVDAARPRDPRTRSRPPRGTGCRRRPRRGCRRHGERRLRVRARPDRDPREAAAALRRGARLRRSAERGGVGARGAPARHEGRDRQRRRADHHAQPRS